MTEKPTPPRKRARKAAASTDKRERILRAAIRVFARKGFYATRVSEIAKAAGVADGTIYLYFKNKDDVLVSIFEDGIGRLLSALREETLGRESATERLERAIELQLGLLEDRRDLAEVITVNLRQSSKLMKQYGAPLFNQYIDFLASIVADGQRKGELRQDVSPRIVARGLWGALDGVAMTWALADGEAKALRRAAKELATIHLEGLRRVDPRRPQQA